MLVWKPDEKFQCLERAPVYLWLYYCCFAVVTVAIAVVVVAEENTKMNY